MPAGRTLESDRAPHEGLRTEHLSLILDIIRQASGSFDRAAFFRLLVETIHRETRTFSCVRILTWDPDLGLLQVQAVAGGAGESPRSHGAQPPETGQAAALETGAAWMAEDLSSLCVPVRSGGRISALLHLESRQPGAFGPAEVALFEILCEHVSNSLEGIRLCEEARCRSDRIRRMTDICRRILAAGSLGEALQLTVRAVVEAYGYYCALVAFVSEDGGHLVLQAHHAQADVHVPEGYRQKVGHGIVGRVAAGRSTVCCNDTAVEPSYVALVAGVKAELCIPLMTNERLVGILDINARETGAFDREAIGLMETLGGLLALTIDKARNLERTRRTRDYLENLITSAGDGIFALDAQGRVERWNMGMERLLGYRHEEIRGQTVQDFEEREIFSRAGDLIGRAMSGETLEGVEEHSRRRDGSRMDAMLTLSPIVGPSGSIEGVSGIVRDVTERRRLEETFNALRGRILESEAKLLDLVEKSHDAIFLLDATDGRVVQANQMAETMTCFSRARLVGRAVTDLHPEGECENARRQFERTVSTGAGPSMELSLVREGAAPLDVEVTSGMLNHEGRSMVHWFCRDISDRRRAERQKEALQLQLLHSEKMSALGQLISGVAHELNNPLTGVIGYSQLLTGIDCDERVRRGIEKVYAEARRCHRVVQNLLTFARKHTPEKLYMSVNEILESTLELRAYQLRVDDISVRSELSKDLPRTMGDFHQLQQVFLNIINNAHQSMHETGRGGSLTIRSSVAGNSIRVEIADTGPGIPPENLKKIFDPFFTTKQPGQGTGLGLSICYGIIEEHDGKILVRSTVGEGTSFIIDLPILGREEPIARHPLVADV